MTINKYFSALFFTFLVSGWFAQQGTIRGVISDKVTGESLPGVIVLIDGTTKGTATDMDGAFELKTSAGIYRLSVSFVTYKPVILETVAVKPGGTTDLGRLNMEEATNELGEVVVAANAIRNTENALLMMKKNAVNVMDGITAAALKKTGDGDAAASVKRVTGVSVSNGKYVYVRGLGDRYSRTMLNGLAIPGLDPDRNTLQMDIFPAAAIDNILVHKSFVAQLPADFTGGVVDLELKAFPEKRSAQVSASGGYNPSFHFQNEYLSYRGGKTDFLGFDDGSRAMPVEGEVPFFSQAISKPNSATGLRYRDILGSFSPGMAAIRQQSYMDYSLGADFGDQVMKNRVIMGYFGVVSYKNSTEFYRHAEYARYGLSAQKSVTEMEMREHQAGSFGANNVLLSGLGGFSVKTDHSAFRLTLLHLQSGESKAGMFDYSNADQGAVFRGFQHNLEYSQRSLTNILLHGSHKLRNKNMEIEWKLSPSYSTMKDPDVRFTRYEIRGDKFVIGTEAGFPQRIWRDLKERSVAGQLNAATKFSAFGAAGKLLYGVAHTYRARDFLLRNFNFNIRNVPLTGNPDELFFPENLWPMGESMVRGTTYEAAFLPVNPNMFQATVNNAAAFVSVEMSPFKILRAVAGLRIENYVQRYTGQDQLGANVLQNDIVLNDFNLFPGINMVYALTDQQNLRISYAHTIARPSLKEMSYAEISDPLTGRTFIGGMFRDANDQAGLVYWDGRLQSTHIRNGDLRWEWFLQRGRMVSAGAYYKYFRNPIEMVQFSTEAGSFQPRNVGDGAVAGVELEFRQDLAPLWRVLQHLSVNMNLTASHSQIKLSATELESRLDNARDGQIIPSHRQMAGQAPYMVNCGILYKAPESSVHNGFEAGLFYNVQGSTLHYVGMVDRPDIYTRPFHSLNFNANTVLGRKKRIKAGIMVENLLGDDTELVYKSFNADDRFFSRLHPGTRCQLRLSYRII